MTNRQYRKDDRSARAFAEARKYIPGGVNSPVRAFKSVDLTPVFVERASGSRVYDIDGNTYIDYIASWGPLILGHAHPEVLRAVTETAEKGTSFGAPTELETEMARLVCERGSFRGVGAHGEFRHGSHDDRAAFGQGLYGKEQDRQV